MTARDASPGGGRFIPRGWRSTTRSGFRRTAYVLALTSLVAGVPSPLYAGYAARFGFSSGSLGLIFASYAAGVFLTQFFVAPQAHRFGRRPLLALGMVLTVAASLVFLFASSVEWLVAARIVSGLAVGATTSVATSAMSDLEPNRDEHHVARVAVAANFGGFAVGAILSGLLVSYAPLPYHLVFLVTIAGSGTGLLALRGTPETLPPPSAGPSAAAERIYVPREIRGPFWIAAGGIAACYSIYGLFGAVIPGFIRSSLSAPSPAVAGIVVGAMFGLAALTQLATAQTRDRRALLVGFPLLLGSLAGLGVVLALPSWAILALVTGCFGVSVGLTFMGSITLIDRLAPEATRDQVLAAFYVVGYLALAVPTIGVAEASDSIGLTTAGLLFVSVLGALVAALWAGTYRTPTPPGGGGRPRGRAR